MVFPHRTLLLIYLVIIALVIGCSGGGGETPTSPEFTESDLTTQLNSESANNCVIWETGEVILDTEELEVSVVPLRTTDFTLNIVSFLQPPAGDPNNLTVSFDIAGSDFPNAFVDLDLKLTHPFPGTQYWGFDVRVIVFGGGSTVGLQDASVLYPDSTELRMTNADGYTRWYNRDEFGPFGKIFGYTDGVMAPVFTPPAFSIVNGFKYFAEGVGEQDVPPNPAIINRGVFSDGEVTREMQLQFPQVTAPFKFKYSIAASWDTPAANPPTSIDDFGVLANQQEAYQIEVTQDPTSTAFYNPDNGEYGGDLILDIEVWDWQADGDPAGEIAEIWIESPTLLSNQGDMVEIKGTWTESAGSTANSVIYSGTLANLAPTAVDDQELFLTVTSADPVTYEPPLSGFLYPSAPLAAYQLFLPLILNTGTQVKTITVTSPNDGENLIIGETFEITWDWTGAIEDVVIEYDLNSGGDNYPLPVVLSTECNGAFTWDPIPDTPTTTARIRITEDLPVPEAQDESDDDFTISTEALPGWNPVPGQVQMLVNAPAPNQSTATPDFGIQNDDAGAEGAWMIDQEGGIGDGSPYFFDYLLDWSGPGGNEYLSTFNYNFAPFGRHDVSSNGVAIFGFSANDDQMSPPVVNDPFTAIWYISYLKDDDASAGDLLFVTWGDEGSVDPPEDDPDEQYWYHTADVSGGMPGWQGTEEQDCVTWLMPYSHVAGHPPWLVDEEADLNIGWWQYPYLTGYIFRLPFPGYTNDLDPPIFQAFHVEDQSLLRIAADNDSYLTYDDTLPSLATLIYMIDSIGNIYCSGYQVDIVGGQFYYMGLGNSEKLFQSEDLYVEGALAVDLEMLPTVTYLYEQDWEAGNNWLAVLFDSGSEWMVRVYDIDWQADLGDRLSIIDDTETFPGDPLAIDVDGYNFTIHVIADNGGDIEATVFDYTE